MWSDRLSLNREAADKANKCTDKTIYLGNCSRPQDQANVPSCLWFHLPDKIACNEWSESYNYPGGNYQQK